METLTMEACRSAFDRFTNRVSFTWLHGLTLDRMEEICAELPPRTCILHTLFLIDAGGIPFEGNEPLRRLHASANAPIFGYFASEFGLGTVGGRLYPDVDLGREAARVAVRILRGEDAGGIPLRILESTPPLFDDRELRRWGVSSGWLPEDSLLRFRPLGFWEQNRWLVSGAVLLILVLAGLVLGLWINRARRREEEAAATLIAEISSKFVNLPPVEVEREIMDAQRRICGELGLDLSGLWQWSEESPPGLRLTHLFRNTEGPKPPEPMLTQEYFPWLQEQMVEGRTIAIVSIEDLPSAAARDRETFRHFGIQSNLTLPLAVGGQLRLGALGFNTTRSRRVWPEALVSRLQMVAQIFANALARKRSQEIIQSNEARLKAGTQLVGLGHYEIDYGAGTCFLDDRFQEICGIPSELSKDRRAWEYWERHLHPEDRPRVVESRQRLHQGTQNSISIEYRILHPEQGEKWIHHLAALAIHRPSGHGVRTFGVIRDITPQKLAHLETEELRGNLTHMSRVNALGALSGSLAHELNQPLGIILSNAQAAQDLLLQDPPNLDEVQEILADIVSADRRAGEVIQRLRALLKRGAVSIRLLDLNEVTEEVLKLTQADLIGKGVTVQRSLGIDLPEIAGDRVQLQQLILNLILNAAEAMTENAPGTRNLHLRTYCQESVVRISVHDHGPGLPADIDRMFQPFYTTKSQGLGMGLAICKSIVQAHHGRLWAESNPGGGAVFHVEIPVATGGLEDGESG
jgi:signal transduction histidine kinase/GAF domain-containing protein